MKITVVGAGYVGLVGGTCFAELGNDVICVDVDEKKIEKLKKKEVPIFEPGLGHLVERNVDEGRLTFTTNIQEGIENSEIIFIAVGTPMGEDHKADLSFVKQVAADIGKHMNGYKIVVTKSTVPVGTTNEVEAIIKENQQEPIDFDVVSNPEFLREGRAVYDFMNPDRIIVGAESDKAKEIMTKLYKGVVRPDRPLFITDIKSAEMIKYSSNAMLATRISFMNEVAQLCEKEGANVKKVAEGMGLDNRIGPRFLQAGLGYGGSCLVGDEIVIVKKDDSVSIVKIKDLFNTKYKDSELLSFDVKKKKMVFKQLLNVTRRKYKGNIVNIRTRMNKTLKCTDDHPLITFEGDKFKIKLARDLALSDNMLAFRSLPVQEKEYVIDVIDLLSRKEFNFNKVRVRPISKRLSEVKEKLGFKPARLRDVTRSNCMNLEEFLSVEDKIKDFICREEILLFTSKGNTTYCPAMIGVGEDFCRFLGYYISEGNIHYERCLRGERARINIHFNINEKEYIEDLKGILEDYDIKYGIKTNEKNSTTSFNFSSRILAFVLKDYLGCGKDSYDADVPDLMFSVSKNKRKEFLKGLFRGDGHIAFPKNTNSVVYDYGSISYSLVHKSILLLSSIGVVPSYKTSTSEKSTAPAHFFRVSTKKQIQTLKNFKDAKIQKKVDSVLAKCKHIKPVGFKDVNDDFSVVKIKKMSASPEEVDVYSVEVKDTHTFVTSHGLIVHNCFPKDVKALIETMKENGVGGKILTAVEEVNELQKQSLLPKIKKLVPDLKGKQVAVWGLAFKPKTDDMREAPAIVVINQLLNEGAKVKAFDPEAMDNAKQLMPDIVYCDNPYDALEGSDVLIVCTEWNEFRSVDFSKVKELMNSPNIVDGRNIYDPKEMKDLGFNYISVGR